MDALTRRSNSEHLVTFVMSPSRFFMTVPISLREHRNRRERRFRQLAEALRHLQQDCGAQTLLLPSTLQTVLTRDDLHLSDAASKLVQEAYQRSQELPRIAEQKLPPLDGK